MKAIRKSDGREIEVYLCQEAVYVEKDGNTKRIYTEDSLILVGAVDWKAFRREAAKDMLSAIMVQNGQDFFSSQHHPFIVKKAIELTDELIKQLKEDEK